jgi:hypothetical protein
MPKSINSIHPLLKAPLPGNAVPNAAKSALSMIVEKLNEAFRQIRS